MDDKLENMPPLGKSVEEVEQDSQNRVNPPGAEGGNYTPDDAAPAPIANTNAGGLGGTFAGGASPVVGAIADPDDPEQRLNVGRDNDDATDNSEA